MNIFLISILSYFIGSISGSYLIGKIFLNKDIRKYGSGNAGTTNALRVFGKKWGFLTFLVDSLKGILISIICIFFLKLENFETLICIFITILGHDYPFYMKFKGGKGVATTVGAFLVLNPYLSLICILIWITVTLITKYVSLGSIILYISFSIIFIVFGNFDTYSEIIIVFISILGIFKHKSNIKRLINRKENKIGDR